MHLGEDTFGVASSATCATGCQNQISVARQLLGKAKRLEADLPAVIRTFGRSHYRHLSSCLFYNTLSGGSCYGWDMIASLA